MDQITEWKVNAAIPREDLPPYCDLSRTLTRPLEGAEIVVHLEKVEAPGHLDIFLSFVLESQHVISLQLVRQAMRNLRLRHPTCAVIILPNKSDLEDVPPIMSYSVPKNDEDVENWLNDVVIQYKPATTSELDDRLVDLRRLVGKTSYQPKYHHGMTIHFIPSSTTNDSCAALLHLLHEFTDGVGAFEVADELCWEVAHLLKAPSESSKWGDEVIKLARPSATREIVKASALSATGKTHVDKAINWMKTQSTIALPWDKSQSNKQLTDTHHTIRKVDVGTLQLLKQRIKANSSTFHPIFTAIVALAIIHMNPPPQPQAFFDMIISPINVRDMSLGEKAGDRTTRKLTTALSLCNYRVELDTTTMEDEVILRKIAKQIDSDWREQKETARQVNDWHDYLFKSMGAALEHINTLAIPPPEDQFPAISSLGIINKRFSGTYDNVLKATKPMFSERLGKGYGVIIHPFTYEGELMINFSYGEAHYSDEKVAKFGDEVVDVLTKIATENLLLDFGA